jgi:hypothetical protein
MGLALPPAPLAGPLPIVSTDADDEAAAAADDGLAPASPSPSFGERFLFFDIGRSWTTCGYGSEIPE